MFSELPKLFDRNFAIAYFLPASLFLGLSAWLLNLSGYGSLIDSYVTGNALIDATLGVLLGWILGILLMVMNRDIYRILEGYGQYNPLRLRVKTVQREFTEKKERLEWLNKQFYKGGFTADLARERLNLMEELALRYPDSEEFVLPTAFGNALRSFEVYPRVMYGFESIYGWSRILAVVPKEYREQIDDAKSQVDWWVNLGAISLIFLIEYWVVTFSRWSLAVGWTYAALNIAIPLAIFLILNWFLLWRATSAAVGWGDYVKAAFDLYRFHILESLHVDLPHNRKDEKELWTKYSQAIVFRLPDLLPHLKTGDKKPTQKKTK